MAAFCAAILDTLERPGHALSVAFVGPSRMRVLNRRYRGRDYTTDVLSFGYGDESVDGAPLLGDLVLAPEVAEMHARRWRTTLEREIRKLLVHGVLHLLGYDHETDDGVMVRLQRAVLRRKPVLASRPLLTRRRTA